MSSLKDIGNLGNVRIRVKEKNTKRPDVSKRKSSVKLSQKRTKNQILKDPIHIS